MARLRGEDRGLFERPKGSGIWWVRYADLHGKDRREKAGTKSQAKSLYNLRQAEKLEGKLPASARARLTLEQLAQKYEPETKASKRSWEGDLVHARAWVAVLGDYDIRDIRPGDIEAAKGRWLSDFKPATVNGRLRYLKTLFNKAVRDNVIETSPLGAKRVKLLRESPPRDRIVSPEEERQLLAALQGQTSRAWFVALYTGLRQAEQFQMTRKDVDLPRRLLRVQDAEGKTKGGSRQWLPISAEVAEVLREQLASHKSPWVWPSDGYGEGDRPLSGDTAYERVKAAAKALGLESGIIWHTARHTYISRLVMLGVPLPTVQKLSRHKSLAMVLRYAHLCPDHTREALEKLAGFSTNGANGRPAPEPELQPAPWKQMAKWRVLPASPGEL